MAQKEWYWTEKGDQCGPYSVAELFDMAYGGSSSAVNLFCCMFRLCCSCFVPPPPPFAWVRFAVNFKSLQVTSKGVRGGGGAYPACCLVPGMLVTRWQLHASSFDFSHLQPLTLIIRSNRASDTLALPTRVQRGRHFLCTVAKPVAEKKVVLMQLLKR